MGIYPTELRAFPQWICWRTERRSGTLTKTPISPTTGGHASTTDPHTWTSFDAAMAATVQYGLQGVGYVFAASDPFCGIDLDKCLDPTTGDLSRLAQDIITRLWTYTAYSVSGRGLHLIVKATLPLGRRQGAFGGLYDAGRFFALTGNLYPGAPDTIADRQAELDALHRTLFPPRQGLQSTATATPSTVSLVDQEILDKMFHARNGATVWRLWAGDTSGYCSHSEADLALCSHLAFWCGGNASRIDALFRQSGLYREKKWNRQDYRERTIAKALAEAAFYSPPRAPTLRASARTYAPGWYATAKEGGVSWV